MIEHTASPFHFAADDPDGARHILLFLTTLQKFTECFPISELIVPAVKGTVGILQSALKYGYGVFSSSFE